MTLSLVVLRRLDCVLDPIKAQVLETATRLSGKVENIDPLLRRVIGEQIRSPRPVMVDLSGTGARVRRRPRARLDWRDGVNLSGGFGGFVTGEGHLV